VKAAKLIKQFRIDDPDDFKLARFDPADTAGLDLDKDDANAMLAQDVERLAKLQERLYADHRWALLVVLQAMDAAGKDGVIKHVMSGVNPQGCDVHPFKAPSAEELDHDFLWRTTVRLPRRGHIGIFNRSYYEEVLVVRVHPEMLAKQKLPDQVANEKTIWKERFKDIRAFERHLARSGIAVLKFFLHISKEEQRGRFLARLDEPAKRWKFSMNDIKEREYWSRYMTAYEDMIRATSHAKGRWYVVPADHKPFARLVVASAMVEALDRLDLKFPEVEGKALAELKKVERALLAEGRKRNKRG
jgi:PPK2 family polyphosphate:nucleotide phosphotransferase